MTPDPDSDPELKNVIKLEVENDSISFRFESNFGPARAPDSRGPVLKIKIQKIAFWYCAAVALFCAVKGSAPRPLLLHCTKTIGKATEKKLH